MEARSRTRLTVLTAALAALALTACSSGGGGGAPSASATPDYSKPATLKLLVQQSTGTQDAFRLIGDDYQKLHPNITIEVNTVPVADYANVIATQVRAGNAPDLFYGAPGNGASDAILDFAKAGYLAKLPADPWLTDRIPDASKDTFRYKGDYYGFPLGATVVGATTNLTAYKAAGLTAPKTFSDLLAQCKQVTAAGKSLWTVTGSSTANTQLFPMILAANEVYATQPDWNTQRAEGKTTFADSKGWKTVFTEIEDMTKAGCFAPGTASAGRPDSVALIGNGQALQRPGPSGVIPELTNGYPGSQFGFVAVPAAKASNTRLISSLAEGMAVNAKSSNVTLAIDYLKFFAQKDESQKYADTYNEVNLADLSSGKFPAGYAPVADLLKNPKLTVPLPNLGFPNGDTANQLGVGFQGIVSGTASVDEVLQSLDSVWGP